MRFILPLLLLLSFQARAEDAPPADASNKWGTASFQDRRQEDARKLAEELLPDAPAPPAAKSDKADKSSAK